MSRIFTRFLVHARRATALDVRALALFRMGLALLLLADILIRAGDLELFYSDAGAVPRSLVQTAAWNPVYNPLYMLSGSAAWSGFLFALAAIFALLLLAGYRTRLFSILSWLLLVALHNRNPFVLQGGDDLLRNALFWSMFLPLGARWSLDAAVGRGQVKRRPFGGMAAAGYTLLVVSVYFFSALQKHSAEWESEGSALYYALSLDQLALPAGKLIYHYPLLLKILTHAAYLIELLGGLLLLVYGWGGRFRLAGLAGLILLHLGIGLTLYVGLFFLIGLVTLLPFLPSRLFNRIEKKISRPDRFSMRKKRAAGLPAALKLFRSFFLGSMVLYCFAWNVTNIPWFPWKLDPPARIPAALLRCDQNWGMFAPKVFKDDGWYIAEALLADSSRIDLFRDGRPVDTAKPERITAMFVNDRHRKYSENLLMTFNDYLRPFYCSYLMRNWNANHPARRIIALHLVYMKEVSLPGYKTAPVERCVLSELR